MKVLHKHSAKFLKLALLCLTLALFPIQAFARDITFVWTAIPEPLTGYKLYAQEGQNSVNAPITLGKITTYTLTGLAADKTYHFYLTAYNDAGESERSAAVTVSPNPSPVILNISLN